MKLISMTDFVLKYDSVKFQSNPMSYVEPFSNILEYAKFLKQPITLSMFIPCDEEGNILIEPTKDDLSFYTHRNLSIQEEFKQAKEKVLFEGFKARITKSGFKAIKKGLEISVSVDSKITVEDLVFDDIMLSDSSLNQIGLWEN